MKKTILVVEDEKAIRNFIKFSLETQDYNCIDVQNGNSAFAMIVSHKPDAMILDLGLPDIDGLEVIKKVREWSQMPIIVVSARGHEREKIEALDAGADDYLTKPFGMPELLARIRVSLRHVTEETSLSKEKEFCLDTLFIDYEKRRVKLDGKEIHLTPYEYSVLTLLCQQHGKVLTHHFIINHVWGGPSIGDVQTLRVCMGNIRRKIEKDPAQPRYIFTEVGVGYRMADE